jgi:hypothetical protein
MFHISLNVAILAIFYTLLGGALSYTMHFLFDEFDTSWKAKRLSYRVIDVCIELILIGLLGFWSMYSIREAPPLFTISKAMDELVDTYNSGIFFSFSLFLFFEDLTAKIKYLFSEAVDPVLKKHFPTKGSILDGSLRF